jgi:2-dehydropantoate 2-reductase
MAEDRKPIQRILVMGCGSVGGIIAGKLLLHRNELTIVTHNEQISLAINTDGLNITTPERTWTVSARAYNRLYETSGLYDVVLLGMKATNVEAAAKDVKQYLSTNGYVVTLQNGLVEDRIAKILGHERVVGGLVGWGASMHAPGVYEMTSGGETIIGELDGEVTDRIITLKTTLEAATTTSVSSNIYGALWSKLAINCTITTLGAVTGQLLGEMLRQRKIRRLALHIISEVVDVATEKGIQLEPVGGTLDIHRLYIPSKQRMGSFHINNIPKHAIMLLVGLKFAKLKSSMLQSIERGRRSEVDYMNGYAVEQGLKYAVPTPVNKSITEMVKEIESGKRDIHPDNLISLMTNR